MYTKNDSIYNSKSQKITKTYILFLDALHNSYGIRKKKSLTVKKTLPSNLLYVLSLIL